MVHLFPGAYCLNLNKAALVILGRFKFSLPLREGIKGRGIKADNFYFIHPHPDPAKGGQTRSWLTSFLVKGEGALTFPDTELENICLYQLFFKPLDQFDQSGALILQVFKNGFLRFKISCLELFGRCVDFLNRTVCSPSCTGGGRF